MGGDEWTILVLQNKSLKKKGLTNKETILVNLEFSFFGLLIIRQPKDHTLPIPIKHSMLWAKSLLQSELLWNSK